MNRELKVSEDLVLYLPTISDAPILFELVEKNRDRLVQFLHWANKSITIEDSLKNINERIEGFENKTSLALLIKSKDVCVGSAGFVKISQDDKTAEIGYWIDKDSEGKGIVSSCVKKLLDYGFLELGLHRIMIKANSNNTRSLSIPKKFHFAHEGTMREDYFDKNNEKYSNTEIFGLLKDEYITHYKE